MLHVSGPSFVAVAVIDPTVTVNGSDAVQLLASVTVTVYVAFVAGMDLLLPVPKPPLQLYVYGEVPPKALAVTVTFGPGQRARSGIFNVN